jgi:hypothetical protein
MRPASSAISPVLILPSSLSSSCGATPPLSARRGKRAPPPLPRLARPSTPLAVTPPPAALVGPPSSARGESRVRVLVFLDSGEFLGPARSNGEPVAMVCNFSLVLCGLDRGTVGRLRSLDYDISGNSFFFTFKVVFPPSYS